MKHDLNRNLQWRAKRLYALFACLVLTLPFAVVPAFAADDPLSVVTSLSDFIFSLIRPWASSCWVTASSRWASPSSPTTPPSAPTVSSPSRAAL